MNARAFALLTGLLLCGMPLAASSDFPSLGSLSDLYKSVKQAFVPATEEQEIAIGRDAAATLLGASKPITNQAVQDYVNKVGLWIALQSDRPGLPWHFAVVDSDDIDAFAAPGGFVFITRGLLLHMHNEAELAGVLGHEITHVVLKHHLNELQRGAKLDLAGQAAKQGAAQEGYDSDLDNELMDQVSGATRNLYSKGLDKGDEIDADRMGVVLAARAGYDPYGLMAVLQTLAAVDPKSGSMQLLLATHPSPDDRIKALSSSMAGGRMDRFGAHAEGQERFEAVVKELVAEAKKTPAKK
ncbi:MAG TPA: M48 family metalloprotease [Gammaproteobacteria bacterium]|jgi:predicted Zn-dependent protease|nr:M48 family metalloprotease [Gammaproteobacteria bacterium]